MTAARRVWAEALLTLLVLAGGVNVAFRYMVDGRLPQPFVFDARDTFMDWFNTAWWAHHPGAFEVWRTVYPPLSFLLLQLFGLSGCYAGDPLTARDCDTLGFAAIFAAYAATAGLAAVAFHRRDPLTAPWRSLTFAFGLPLLFALERGNLILLCLPFFILAYGGLSRSVAVRAVAAAVTVNLKPYLVVPVLAWVVRREWRQVRLAVVAGLAIYLVSFALFGSGDPVQLVSNTIGFARVGTVLVWEQGLYSTSFAPFLSLDTGLAPNPALVEAATPGWLLFLIPFAVNATRALALACAVVGTWWRPDALTGARVALLLLGTYLIGQSPGGYTQTFLIFLLFLERAERRGPAIALVAGYLLSVPCDHVLWNVLHRPGDSWLSGLPIGHEFGIAVGMYVRPLLILLMIWSLAVDSLLLIARAPAPTGSVGPEPVAA
ncbi:hypothetical protein [Sphingomonas sp.]|uniref:hypothetical protein n=1 Tax=Sphingomonas sp. TaxID=28214 RepID=UPI003B00E627